MSGVAWFVVGMDVKGEGCDESYNQVWGEFATETDARAFAIDLFADNGWEAVIPFISTAQSAVLLASDKKIWDPYRRGDEQKDQEVPGSDLPN